MSAQVMAGTTTQAHRSLSAGLGVQSSTLALMSVAGELPRLDSVIFADTGNETTETYEWADFLQSQIEAVGIPFYRVSAGNLLEDHLTATTRVSQAPVFTWNEQTGEQGRIMRRCSRDYKVYPVRRKARELMLAAGLRKIEQWVGISWDEVERMNDKGPAYISTAYPLVDLRMTRGDCLAWMEAHGFPRPPRSACYWCPQASNERWVTMRDFHPVEFKRAVEADYALRAHGVPGIDGTIYLHKSCKPLDEANIDNDDGQMSLFDDPDCEGGCFL